VQLSQAFTNLRANNPKFGAHYSDRAIRRVYLNLEIFLGSFALKKKAEWRLVWPMWSSRTKQLS
jgi:hypothetical protein